MKHMDWTPKTRNRLSMQLQLLLMVLLHLKMIRKTQLLPIWCCILHVMIVNIYKLLSRTWMFILEKDMSLQLQLLLMLLLPLKMIKKTQLLAIWFCILHVMNVNIYKFVKQNLNVHIIEGHAIFLYPEKINILDKIGS